MEFKKFVEESNKYSMKIESAELVHFRGRTMIQLNLIKFSDPLRSKWVYFFGVKKPDGVKSRGLCLVRSPAQKVFQYRFYHFKGKFHKTAFGIYLIESKVKNEGLKKIQYNVELIRPCLMPNGALSLQSIPFKTLFVKEKRPLSIADKLNNFICMLRETRILSDSILKTFIKIQESNDLQKESNEILE